MKKIRGRRGKPDTIEYLVNIDLGQYDINKEQLADFKELFTLFDKVHFLTLKLSVSVLYI